MRSACDYRRDVHPGNPLSPFSWPEHTAAFDLRVAIVRNGRQALADGIKGACDKALHKTAPLGEPHAHRPVDLAIPSAQGVLRQQRASLAASLKIIDTKIVALG